MFGNRKQVTFLAFVALAGCGTTANDNNASSVGSRTSALGTSWGKRHDLACRTCNFNGSGIYEDNQFIDNDYGLMQSGIVSPWALLGFENGTTVKANWGKADWSGTYTYTHQQTNVNSATYGSTSGYTVASITTNTSTSNAWDRTALTVVIKDGAGVPTTVSGSNLQNLILNLTSPVALTSGQTIDLKIGPETYHNVGDHIPEGASRPTLTGYQTTYKIHGSSNPWMPYCNLGDNPSSEPEDQHWDYMVPFSYARIGDSHADITTSDAYVTFGCLRGALGWTLDWGWHPWISGMSWNAFGSVIQGKRAAYCGRESYTNNSITFRHADNLSPHVEDPGSPSLFGLGMGQHLESWWTPTQATCLHTQRDTSSYGDFLTQGDNFCSLSACTTTPGTWYFVTAACW